MKEKRVEIERFMKIEISHRYREKGFLALVFIMFLSLAFVSCDVLWNIEEEQIPWCEIKIENKSSFPIVFIEIRETQKNAGTLLIQDSTELAAGTSRSYTFIPEETNTPQNARIGLSVTVAGNGSQQTMEKEIYGSEKSGHIFIYSINDYHVRLLTNLTLIDRSVL
ncbi:MAG: hypothetical protein LBC27_10040 [Spirochaetaceae bacterium]|nr:hypothetical protein [Spirochaetaceae bacterium]